MSSVSFRLPGEDGAPLRAKEASPGGASLAASSRYSSVASIREAYVAIESEDEGALGGGFKFSWRRLMLHMG